MTKYVSDMDMEDVSDVNRRVIETCEKRDGEKLELKFSASLFTDSIATLRSMSVRFEP
jgi:hypothetical protein